MIHDLSETRQLSRILWRQLIMNHPGGSEWLCKLIKSGVREDMMGPHLFPPWADRKPGAMAYYPGLS